MGGGVVGSAVGTTTSSGGTPASDTYWLRPEKMFIGLKTKSHPLVYYTQKTVTTHPVLFSKYYFQAPATQATNFQERKYWVLAVIVKKVSYHD